MATTKKKEKNYRSNKSHQTNIKSISQIIELNSTKTKRMETKC